MQKQVTFIARFREDGSLHLEAIDQPTPIDYDPALYAAYDLHIHHEKGGAAIYLVNENLVNGKPTREQVDKLIASALSELSK